MVLFIKNLEKTLDKLDPKEPITEYDKEIISLIICLMNIKKNECLSF